MKSALVMEDLPEIRTWLAEVAREAFPGLHVAEAEPP